MNTQAKDLFTLSEFLIVLIDEYRHEVSESIKAMGSFNISKDEFRNESFKMNVAAFTLGYLGQVKEIADKGDFKTTANFIRFQKHQLEKKAGDENDPLRVAQDATIRTLTNIIKLYLN
ncbi:MAG: hypothetical protein K2M59_03625 [Muribaculaceae bacterium]|nr:hypothetical protein [Muribaculaceae bacterium]MDE7465502.1 hypothetical protein [Muribaculaceae bacterium]